MEHDLHFLKLSELPSDKPIMWVYECSPGALLQVWTKLKEWLILSGFSEWISMQML